MNIETAKQINLADYLHSLGYSPVKQQGINPVSYTHLQIYLAPEVLMAETHSAALKREG